MKITKKELVKQLIKYIENLLEVPVIEVYFEDAKKLVSRKENVKIAIERLKEKMAK